MRTTLDIDDDVLLAAKELGRRDKRSIGSVISELARRSLQSPAAGTSESPARVAREPQAAYGFQPFASRGGIITNDLIDRLRDDDLE